MLIFVYPAVKSFYFGELHVDLCFCHFGARSGEFGCRSAVLLLIGGCWLNLKLWNVFFGWSLCRMLGSGVNLASEVEFEQVLSVLLVW